MPTDQDDVAKDEERGPVADAEYYDSAVSRPDVLDDVLPEQPEQQRDDDDASGGLTTARSDGRTTLTESGQTQRNLQEDAAKNVVAEEGSSDPAEDNLIQLPIGAKFGMDHEPTPQEREDLVRFAAAANAELHGEGEEQVDQHAEK